MLRIFGIVTFTVCLLIACADDSSDSSAPSGAYSEWFTDDEESSLLQPCRTATEDNCIYDTLVDARDGQVYKTVKIGDQVWMAENLNFASEGSFCIKANNCKGNGRLYGRKVMFDTVSACKTRAECDAILPVQGVCPDGWHVSTVSDWDRLFAAIGNKIALTLLVKDGAWSHATRSYRDAFGFSLEPTPAQEGDGMEKNFSYIPYPDDRDNDDYSDVYSLSPDGLSIYGSGYSFSIVLGVGVRCVQNEEGAVGTVSHMTPVVEKKNLSDFLNPNIPYGELVDARDGHVYKTVVIGTQTWMAQNLNFNTGDSLSMCYDGSEEFCDKFGRLYYKDAAMRADICPAGWHVPSPEEMKVLLDATCLDSAALTYNYEPLMAEGAWHFPDNTVVAKNEFGFSMMPSVNLYTIGIIWKNDGSSLIAVKHNRDIRMSNTRGSIRCLMDSAAVPENGDEIGGGAEQTGL